jgi:hypothetical protein
MDLSKLPRLSETKAAQAANQPSDAPPTDPGSHPAGRPCPLCGTPLPRDAQFCHRCGGQMGAGDYAVAPPAPGGAEIWISAVLGVIFILIGRRFGAYLISLLSGKPFDTGVIWRIGEKAGTPVPYWELQGYTALSEAGIFLFGVLLLLEAIVLGLSAIGWRWSRPAGYLMLALAVCVTALNLIVSILLFSNNITPLQSLLAAAFGGYLVFYQLNVLRAGRSRG